MFRLLTLLFFLLLNTQSALAAEIVIEDSSGIVRHVSEVQSNTNIKFTVTDPDGQLLDGAVVYLSTKDSSEKRQGIAVAGVVEFFDVAPGTWVVSTETPKLLFTQISVDELGAALAEPVVTASGGTASLSTGTMAGVGILAAGGITGLVIALDESNSNDKTELSPAS